MATPSLSPSFVIGILAKREAIKAVKADLQARVMVRGSGAVWDLRKAQPQNDKRRERNKSKHDGLPSN